MVNAEMKSNSSSSSLVGERITVACENGTNDLAFLVLQLVLDFHVAAFKQCQDKKISLKEQIDECKKNEEHLLRIMSLMWAHNHELTGSQIAENYHENLMSNLSLAEIPDETKGLLHLFLESQLAQYNNVHDAAEEHRKEKRAREEAVKQLREIKVEMMNLKETIKKLKAVQGV